MFLAHRTHSAILPSWNRASSPCDTLLCAMTLLDCSLPASVRGSLHDLFYKLLVDYHFKEGCGFHSHSGLSIKGSHVFLPFGICISGFSLCQATIRHPQADVCWCILFLWQFARALGFAEYMRACISSPQTSRSLCRMHVC